MCASEKSATKLACCVKRDTFSSPVCGRDSRNCGHFERFCGECSPVSLQPRLRGGAGSLALTLLRQNSLVTGNLTGNFEDFSLRKPHLFSLSCTFQSRNRFRTKIRAGNFQGQISEFVFVISDPCRESSCWRRTSETKDLSDLWNQGRSRATRVCRRESQLLTLLDPAQRRALT